MLASFLYSSVLAHKTLEQALAFVLANKLASPTLYSTQLKQIAEDVYAEDPSVIAAAMADLQAVLDRDPACDKFTQALLHFKGFQAIQCHRVAHHLWLRGRRALALMLQSRISEAFHVDIHPAATVGRGILLDHATGVVIGETAVIGDNVSMLHHVTLGGSGLGKGVRHPQIGHGCLLGAGVTVLGPVSLGAGVKVGAGSVVVTNLEPHSVAVGVPARVIKRAASDPSNDMDQIDFMLDYVIVSCSKLVDTLQHCLCSLVVQCLQLLTKLQRSPAAPRAPAPCSRLRIMQACLLPSLQTTSTCACYHVLITANTRLPRPQ